jgi:hypothetical protein
VAPSKDVRKKSRLSPARHALGANDEFARFLVVAGVDNVSLGAESGLGGGAATETPCVADVFGGGYFFDSADWREFGP